MLNVAELKINNQRPDPFSISPDPFSISQAHRTSNQAAQHQTTDFLTANKR
jgi:hypothetical protein